jgi:rhodanese-related sulfurtransferase
MKTILITAFQVVVILAAASAVAVAYNGVSDKGLKWSKNYFAKSAMPRPPVRPNAPSGEDEPAIPASGPEQSAGPISETPKKHLDHIFQVATYEDVAAAVNDPLYAEGLYVCVDARDDENFAAGRIPGAKQMFPYYADQHLPQILSQLQIAEKVIVYCTGGDCEDSIFACRELLEQSVPFEVIYLYEGGIKDWQGQGGQVETGE